jgi:actin-like ATPase involved in cell morphogenesis
MREVTNLNIRIADDPLTCVVRGAGRILERLEDYDKVILSGHRD